MKKISILFSAFLCVFFVPNAHAFSTNINQQFFNDESYTNQERFVLHAHPDQISIQENEIYLDIYTSCFKNWEFVKETLKIFVRSE